MIKTSKNVSKALPKAGAEDRRGEREPVHLNAHNPEMMEMSPAVKTIGLCLQPQRYGIILKGNFIIGPKFSNPESSFSF